MDDMPTNSDPVRQKRDGDGPGLETVNLWSSKAGYSFRPDRGASRRERTKGVFTSIGQMSNAKVQQAVAPVARPGPADGLPSDFSTIRMTRAFKGADDKKTCLMDVSGTPVVVKAGTVQSADHIEATAFIANLAMPGVSTVAVRALTVAESDLIVSRLDPANKDAQELAKALNYRSASGGCTGQVSALAGGDVIKEQLLSKGQAEQVQKDLDVRKGLQGLPRDEAWNRSFEELQRIAVVVKKADPALMDRFRNAKTPEDRQAAIDWLIQKKVHVVDSQGNVNKALLNKRLAEIHADQLKEGTEAAEANEAARKATAQQVFDFAASDQGINAFAGMAVGDLLTGMDDRVMSKWNPENFLLDLQARQLCCIDNQKDPNKSISAADEKGWLEFFQNNMTGQGSLEDMIFHQVYEPANHSKDLPYALHQHLTFSADGKKQALARIRAVVETAMNKIEADPAQGPQVKARVRTMRMQQGIADLLKRPASLGAPPAPPVKLGKGEKIERAAGSAVNRLMALRDSSRKDFRDKTQKIKDRLRSGALTPQQAQTQLEALQQQQGPQSALAADRRSTKIMFLVKGMEFAAELDQLKTDLDTALAQFQPVALPDKTLSAMGAPLQKAFANWQQAYQGERSVADKLQAKWAALPKAVTTKV